MLWGLSVLGYMYIKNMASHFLDKALQLSREPFLKKDHYQWSGFHMPSHFWDKALQLRELFFWKSINTNGQVCIEYWGKNSSGNEL